jgi:hypothetical protein
MNLSFSDKKFSHNFCPTILAKYQSKDNGGFLQ